jgi:dienelactone hydrolase
MSAVTTSGRRLDCEVHVYQGADHGFIATNAAGYHAQSAKVAWGRDDVPESA